MSNAFPPAPQHDWLKKNTGNWTVECAYFMAPGEDPIEVEGKEFNDMLGEFWSIGRFEADLLGSTMIGQSSIGYDPVKKVFVSTWKDSSTPFHYTFEGELDEERNALLFEGENYDPVRQEKATYRSKIKFLSEDERVLSLSVEAGGSEVPILEYRYKRA
ncbi:MAG: DUF1579 family protein [Verrucomicrobiota bacterium]